MQEVADLLYFSLAAYAILSPILVSAALLYWVKVTIYPRLDRMHENMGDMAITMGQMHQEIARPRGRRFLLMSHGNERKQQVEPPRDLVRVVKSQADQKKQLTDIYEQLSSTY